jgi:putative ABC transport system permease protein
VAARSTVLLARKSIRARLGRTIAIAVAITASVSFVVGSFVLADSLKAVFDQLFEELSAQVDLQVRSTSETDDGRTEREPIPVEIADDVSQIDGIEVAEPTLTRYAQLLDDEGEAVSPAGGPTLGVSWEGDAGIQGLTIKDGAPPSGADELAIDKATGDREDFAVGDTVTYITDTGQHSGTITALVGLGDTDSFGGASLVAVDLETALDRFGADGKVDSIDVAVAEGADEDTVQSSIESILPERMEVVTGEEVAQENSDAINQFIDIFGTGLLVFAFVTAFVSAFIINNVFQITIGQRLRELALLRAVGASGRQVRRMVTVEAFILGVIATVLGIIGGVLVARLLVAGFNAAGAGFPTPSTILAARTIVMAAVVGVGITMLSVIVPSRRAARIPPVAAMRPELGFSALRARRLVAGVVLTVVGGAAFLIGLLVRPGGATTLIVLAGGGALMLFLGVASVSSTIARPVTRVIGWPIEKLFKVPGALARENVARAPRRTSSSAAALMVGVSLVSAAAVFASSLRATFVDTLENAISADYIITDEGFQGMSPVVSETLAEVDELVAVTPIRQIAAIVDDDSKAFGAVDPVAFDEMVNADVRDGSIADLGLDELALHEDPAGDLDLEVGSVLAVTYQNGVTGELTVGAIYADSNFGNWLISLETLDSVTDVAARDLFVMGKLADDVTPEAGDAAVRAAMEEFPQVEVQTNAEFRRSQEDQINQLLIIITMLLAFAILIAVLGISITLALGVFERTREIGLLRAVGMNRRQLRRSVRWEAVIVSVFGAGVGIVLGTFLGIVVSVAVPEDVINQLAFSMRMIIFILVGAVIAGLFAALYPSFKASRMDVLDAIATE